MSSDPGGKRRSHPDDADKYTGWVAAGKRRVQQAAFLCEHPWPSVTFDAMPRDTLPLLLLLPNGGFLLFILATVGLLAGGEARPAELLTSDSPRVPDVVAVVVHDLATVTLVAANRLDSKWTLLRVVIDGPRDRQDKCAIYEIRLCDDPQGVLFLASAPPVDGVQRVQVNKVNS